MKTLNKNLEELRKKLEREKDMLFREDRAEKEVKGE